MSVAWYVVVLCAVVAAIAYVGWNYVRIKKMPEGTAEEMAALQASYEHLEKMRDEIISLGIIPAVADWKEDNANL